MYPNLRAEQSRRNLTNQKVAEILGISRPTYEKKKKCGSFTVKESKILCEIFGCDFDYLFTEEDCIARTDCVG